MVVAEACRLVRQQLLRTLAIALAAGSACAQIVAIDDAGQRVELAAPAERIVTLSPHLAELVSDAGAGARLVGVAAHSVHPPDASGLAQVGDARGIDLEAVRRLHPDLVIAWSSGNPRRIVDRLRRLGIAVFESEPRRLADIPRTLERVGVLAGTQTQALAAAAVFRSRLEQLINRHARALPATVFYQIWERPLMTISDRHILGDALQTCGARNVFGRLKSLSPSVDREAAVLANPDVILVASAAPDALRPWLEWTRMRAVAAGRVVAFDPNGLHRPAVRMLDAVAALCERLEVSPRP